MQPGDNKVSAYLSQCLRLASDQEQCLICNEKRFGGIYVRAITVPNRAEHPRGVRVYSAIYYYSLMPRENV